MLFTMAKTELTDQQWEAELAKSYLTSYSQPYVAFSLDYAKGYRLVMPKRTFIAQCCFFCLEGKSNDDDDYDDGLSNQGVRTEHFPEDHPMSNILHCGKEKCRISAQISEQVHIADRKIAVINPKSKIQKGTITVKRTNGNLESDWTMRHYQYSLPKDGNPGELSFYVLKPDGTCKGFMLDEFFTVNVEAIRQHGVADIAPHFDQWYPPTRKAEIMKLFEEYIAKAGL